jgi:hypothetical protein
MTDTAIHNTTMETNKSFIMDKDTVITNGSAITIRSNQSSLLDSDDGESSHDSIDTIATIEHPTEKDVLATSIPTRRRALTVTQTNHTDSKITPITATAAADAANAADTADTAIVANASGEENMDMMDIHGQIHELQESLIKSNHNNDSDSEEQEDPKQHKRLQSHRSTMSSIHSFVSSASNYDLLLARLGSKDASPTIATTTLDTPTQEIRNSFERVKSDAVDSGQEDEIDWGKKKKNYKI